VARPRDGKTVKMNNEQNVKHGPESGAPKLSFSAAGSKKIPAAVDSTVPLPGIFLEKPGLSPGWVSMEATPELFDPWLRDYLQRKCPELRPAMQATLDAIDREERVTPQLIAPLVEAVTTTRRCLLECAACFLSELTGRYEAACDAVARMARDAHSEVRLGAILCLGKRTPRRLAVDILRQGLRDPSARVRGKAADWAGRLRLRELVADLEAAAHAEDDSKTAEVIRFALKLLRDGYLIEPQPGGTFAVVAYGRNGITSRLVPRRELRRRGLDAIVAELGEAE
jgi:hypothetical protein